MGRQDGGRVRRKRRGLDLRQAGEVGAQDIAIERHAHTLADAKSLFDATQKAFGKLDILVNNAGVYKFAPIEDVTEADYRWHFDINVLGPLLTTKEALKHFPAEGGSIINVSSVAAFSPTPTASVYSGTKGALDTISLVLAHELGPRNVRVNSLNPGITVTEGVHTLGVIGSDFEKDLVGKTPLRRAGQPEDIAKVAVFLASDDSRWVTGERLAASGGLR